MANYKVPYVNYKAQSKLYGDEILKEIKRVMDAGDYILRDDVERFEKDFTTLIGANYAVGMNSCTDAMRLILRVLEIPRGREVIVSAHTFLATLDAIVDAGLKPVLVDSKYDYNIDESKIEDAITGNTVAIMPVHLNGRCCDMPLIMSIAKKYKLYVIEDAAQALCSTVDGKCAGTFGDASAFSFFPAKILGTIGDAGVAIVKSEALAKKLRAMRDYGRVKGEEQVVCYGQNSRLDNVHAAILNVKMKYLKGWIERRREIAALYHDGLWYLQKEELSLPMMQEEDKRFFDIFQNYVIRVKDRDNMLQYLNDKGIEVLVHWETPLNKQKVLNLDKYKLPVTEAICDECISLPMYQELTNEQVEYVCECIRRYYK